MTFQRCPRCGSNRVRRGYIRTPWWSAIIGRYQMLCNACNWEFVGFAVPGTLSTKSKKRRKTVDKAGSHTFNDESETISIAETSKLGETGNSIETEEDAPEDSPENSEESDANESSANDAVKAQNGNNTQIRRIKHKKRVRMRLNK